MRSGRPGRFGLPQHCPVTLTYLVAALTLLVTAANNVVPEQVHIAYAGRDTNGMPLGMAASWFTRDETSDSTIQFGISIDALTQTATGSHVSYMSGKGYHSHVEMLGLQMGMRYHYRVGSASANTWSNVFSFKTASAAQDTPFSVSIFGDMGYKGSKDRPMIVSGHWDILNNWSAVESRTILERLKDSEVVDFIWHLGDIGYIDDSFLHTDAALLKFTYEETYNSYMNWIENLTSALPYMVLPGNHESECHSPACVADPFIGRKLRNFTAYNSRWHMPSASSEGRSSMWYSFNHGSVHFVSMNTETDFNGAAEEKIGDGGIPWLTSGGFGKEGEYLKWLENDLMQAAADRDSGGRQWIVAGGHRPLDLLSNSSGIRSLLEKYGVDVYFTGHIHEYRRSAPSLHGQVDAAALDSPNHYKNSKGVIEIVVGNPGCEEGDHQQVAMEQSAEGCAAGVEIGSGTCIVERRKDKFISHAAGSVRLLDLSTGVLDMVNATALHWRLIGSVDGKILDDLWVTKTFSAGSNVSIYM